MTTTGTDPDVKRGAEYVLTVTLTSGDTLRCGSSSDRRAVRDELMSMQRQLESETFVRIGEDAIVRSADVRTVQVEGEEDGQGLFETLKDKIGGRQMTQTETEQGGPQGTVYGPQGTPATRQGNGEAGFADQYIGYGRRPYAETKPFFLTSEFLAFVLGVAGVLIAAGMADNFDAPRAWLIAAIITAAYIVSRGIAKAGSRDPNPREWPGAGGFGGWNR